MLIEDKSLEDIKVEDLEALVGVKERGRLEFKESIGNTERDKLELLRDICAMVNADGGLIVIGAKTSGEQCTGFVDLPNPDGNAQRIRQSVLDSIEDRILDFGVKPFQLPPGVTVLVVYVPSSFAKPHMIKINKKTEFWKRYETDKRPMTIAEIRSAFINTSGAMSLRRVEEKVDRLYQGLTERQVIEEEKRLVNNVAQIHKITNTKVLMDKLDDTFKKELGSKRALRLTITPNPLVGELANPSDKELLNMLRNPPNQRYAGWNMGLQNSGNFRITSLGFQSREPLKGEMLLLRNGHFEFRTEIDGIFSWNQDPQEFKAHPLLYPLAVTEYPVSFLRFAIQLYAHLKYQGPFVWRMLYYNIKGCKLRPHHPQAIGFLFDARVLTENDLNVQADLEPNYNPDSSALVLIKELYYNVGFTREHIPFFDKNDHFSIPNE